MKNFYLFTIVHYRLIPFCYFYLIYCCMNIEHYLTFWLSFFNIPLFDFVQTFNSYLTLFKILVFPIWLVDICSVIYLFYFYLIIFSVTILQFLSKNMNLTNSIIGIIFSRSLTSKLFNFFNKKLVNILLHHFNFTSNK